MTKPAPASAPAYPVLQLFRIAHDHVLEREYDHRKDGTHRAHLQRGLVVMVVMVVVVDMDRVKAPT